jgi:predicted SprT family Zn-dependent metalloprotease
LVKTIPKPTVAASFTLAGFNWSVRFIEGLSEYGICDPTNQEIRLRAGMNEQMTHQTFYHELVHAIMFTMGKTNHDEEFTDVFGSLLHQYERTKN